MEIVRRITDYSIRALVHLALNPEREVTGTEISEEQDVPLGYVHKIMQRLNRYGFVNSHRGPSGGFFLAKNPGKISVLEIAEAMQGKLSSNKCFLEKDPCPRAPKCVIKKNWLALDRQITGFLKSISLQDLVDQMVEAGS
ncbi:MAG: RrF2 family transcriptional regulator [Bacillota bacterium]|jgi:Rrf2 family protein